MNKEQKTVVPFAPVTPTPRLQNEFAPASNPGDARKTALAELSAKMGTAKANDQASPPVRFVDPVQRNALAVRDPVRRAQFADLRSKIGIGRSRVAFQIDATSSRSASWKEATATQSRMVDEARQFGRIELRIIHFGGG